MTGREGGFRDAAIEAGQTTYETGKPCVKGHVAPRYVANRGCVECNREKNLRALEPDNGPFLWITRDWRPVVQL